MEGNHYILEYNEKCGFFHYNDGSARQNTYNWITIYEDISEKQCEEFCDLMFKKYPSINNITSENRSDFPSLELIKSDFMKFMSKK